jgi:N-methylhydantoinase A
MSLRIGADVGGTFTDIIVMDDTGGMWTHKVPSSPPDFEIAVMAGIRRLIQSVPEIQESRVTEVVHGTTVATNAVLERRGARTALVTTKGFRDVFEIRRLRVPELFNLFFEKPTTLVERHLRFELSERVSATGEILESLKEGELAELLAKLRAARVESVAVCFLHSYAFPEHEIAVGRYISEHLPKVAMSLSCEILRERREYERTATTVVNSYVMPVVRQYLAALATGLKEMGIEVELQVMQSSGGLTPESDAATRPVYMLESGPASGVLAAQHIALSMADKNFITFDMGGTTAKASLIENGVIHYSSEYEVGSSLSCSSRLVGGAGEIIRVPTIDIAEVGAGGGSIAYIDSAGGLHVGPRSAGADPGPVCYNAGGTEPTLTDANAVLGYIRPGPVANGDVSVDPEAAGRTIEEHIARPLGYDVFEAAYGIHRIANAATMRALSEVSTQRGRDPREYRIIAFGGSGPIQAAGISREFGVKGVIVPPIPGLLSSAGLLYSDIEHHDIRSCMLTGDLLRAETFLELWSELETAMLERFRAEGFDTEQVTLDRYADLRYQGQFSEIRIHEIAHSDHGMVENLINSFEREYATLYGHTGGDSSDIEVVAVRLVGRYISGTERGTLKPARAAVRPGDRRKAYFGERWGRIDTPVINRADVSNTMKGPLLIDEYDSTIVVPPDMTATLDIRSNIVMEPLDE